MIFSGPYYTDTSMGTWAGSVKGTAHSSRYGIPAISRKSKPTGAIGLNEMRNMRPINIFSSIQTVTDEWTTPISRRMFHTWENGFETQSLVTREEIKEKITPTAARLHHIRTMSMDQMKMPIGAPIKNNLNMQLRFYTYNAKHRAMIQAYPWQIDNEGRIIPFQP